MAVTLRRPRPYRGTLTVPGSKSLTNRALPLAALAERTTTITGALVADDTTLMENALVACGVAIERVDETTRLVHGIGARLGQASEPLYVGTAGTAARFLTALFAGGPGGVTIDGSARMRERPMGTLIEALREQGANLECLEREHALPLSIARATLRGGEIRLARPVSSQFVSALLLSALRAAEPTTIVLEAGTPARPYVDMTLAVIRAFGGHAEGEGSDTLRVEPGLSGTDRYAVEPDASAASYFLALAAIYGDEVTIPGLGSDSLQGDSGFFRVLETMGARASQSANETTVSRGELRGADLDLTDMPDMALTAAVVALFARGETRIRGVGILRHHESDRIAAGATELRKLGANVTEHEDGLTIVAPVDGPRSGVGIDTYDDHRMAMAFSLVGDVEIREPGCVAKTFPRYFDVLAQLGMVVR